MNDIEFIKKFVSSHEIEKNRYSCLMIALIDARKLTARNIETGKFECNILENEKSFLSPYSFIGIINYLLILDMIGEIFTVRNTTNKIYKALKQYCSYINDKDIDTIIALRNSLAHNYGLINIPDNPEYNLTRRHKFYLINSEIDDLIEYPTKPWNGVFNDNSDDSYTKVGLGKLIELVESVYQVLKKEIECNPMKNLSLKEGVDELKARFTVRY